MIELENVKKSYGRNTVLENLKLTVSDGEFVFLVGRSGSGKSTLLNVLALFDAFDSGSYKLDGKEIGKLRREHSQIRNSCFGFVFQAYCLIENLTAYENIKLPFLYSEYTEDDLPQRIADIASRLGISDILNKEVRLMSGGEKQRVAFARAVINNPRYIFCDEPTGNLDDANTDAIMSFLHDVNERGTTVIVVTHDTELVKHEKGTVYEIREKKLCKVRG